MIKKKNISLRLKTTIFVGILTTILFLGVSDKIAYANISLEEAREYVRTTWNFVDVTDSVLDVALQQNYEGIPYLEWIGLLANFDDLHAHLDNEEYYTAMDLGVTFIKSISFFEKILTLQFPGVISTASLANAPIQYALVNFYQSLVQTAIQNQIKLYIRARELGCSHTSILDATCVHVEMFAEEGWLYIVDADHKIPPYAPVDVPSNTPEQIYNAANKVWNATQQSEQYTKDKEVVGKNFKQVLFETSPNYNITPAISLLLNESKDYGVFYNINVEAGGTLDSTIQVKGNNLNGYMNFTEMPLDNIPLCGAGNISGQLINENLTGSFVSSDDDTGCWFDDGGIFTLIGSLDNAGHYTGTYSITNANGSNLN